MSANQSVQLKVPQTEAVPLSYQVPGAQLIELQAVYGEFDGSGAAGSYLPAVEILSQDGLRMMLCPVSTSVAAGSDADVTFGPFLRGATGGGGGGGIQFDTQPQAGQFLYVETDGPGYTIPGGWGIQLNDQSGNGIEASSDWDIEADSGHVIRLNGANASAVAVGLGFGVSTAGEINMTSTGNTSIRPTGALILDSQDGPVSIASESAGQPLTLAILTGTKLLLQFGASGGSTTKVQIADNLGHPFLEVRQDGTYHIKTGASWVADL